MNYFIPLIPNKSFLYSTDNILQPSNNILQPQNTNAFDDLPTPASKSSIAAAIPVGSTWSNAGSIGIDLDNLLSGKTKNSGPAPSMNQLKVQSPVKSTSTLAALVGIQPNLIGGSGTSPHPQQKPQYSNIPIQHQQSTMQPQQQQKHPANLFGNLVQTNPTNFNNQFNAFQ